MVMIHWHPGWLGSWFNVIAINIFVKAYGENEWGSFFMNPEAPGRLRSSIDIGEWPLCEFMINEHCASLRKPHTQSNHVC